MAKKNVLRVNKVNVEPDDFFDFGDEDIYDQDAMIGVINGLLEANHKQMLVAIELTKLIIANKPVKNAEEDVFSVFKEATKVVSESTHLKQLMDQIK